MDLYRDQVFCFTPRGDLIALPRGATVVDFAYAVHTQIGETCVGVRINGKTRQLATELQNGDQIDILTSSHAKPRAEWESFV
ncbi:MAG: TGS domain-containing protein, partial [Alphaproteobacteria bacterium]